MKYKYTKEDCIYDIWNEDMVDDAAEWLDEYCAEQTKTLKAELQQVKAERDGLREAILKAIDEDAKPDELYFEWLSRIRNMLVEAVESEE
jgi:hypothetical protein